MIPKFVRVLLEYEMYCLAFYSEKPNDVRTASNHTPVSQSFVLASTCRFFVSCNTNPVACNVIIILTINALKDTTLSENFL